MAILWLGAVDVWKDGAALGSYTGTIPGGNACDGIGMSFNGKHILVIDTSAANPTFHMFEGS